MNKTFDRIILVIVAVIVVAFAGYSLLPKSSKPFGNAQNNYLTGATMSTSSVSTSWVLVSPKETRNWTVISTAGAPIYLAMVTSTNSSGTALDNVGVYLASSSSMTFDLDHLFTGNIYAKTLSGTVQVNVTDFK